MEECFWWISILVEWEHVGSGRVVEWGIVNDKYRPCQMTISSERMQPATSKYMIYKKSENASYHHVRGTSRKIWNIPGRASALSYEKPNERKAMAHILSEINYRHSAKTWPMKQLTAHAWNGEKKRLKKHYLKETLRDDTTCGYRRNTKSIENHACEEWGSKGNGELTCSIQSSKGNVSHNHPNGENTMKENIKLQRPELCNRGENSAM